MAMSRPRRAAVAFARLQTTAVFEQQAACYAENLPPLQAHLRIGKDAPGIAFEPVPVGRVIVCRARLFRVATVPGPGAGDNPQRSWVLRSVGLHHVSV